MKISSGGKSVGQMEEISTGGRSDRIKEEHLGENNEDMKRKAKIGNGGVDGERFLELYKQINKDKVSQLSIEHFISFYIFQASSTSSLLSGPKV